MKAEYILVLFLILIAPLILSRDRRLGLYRHWKVMLLSMAFVSLFFWVWDVAATARGHWQFNEKYVLGLAFLDLPLEEWLFFVVISFVSIFTWEASKHFLRKK